MDMENTGRKVITIPIPSFSRLVWIAIAVALLAGGAGVYFFVQSREKEADKSISQAPEISAESQPVVALGYIEPRKDVIKVTAPSVAGSPATRNIVDKLLVKVGETVRRGQVIATLTTLDSQQAAVEAAQAQVNVSEAQLAQAKTGAKPDDIQAQEAAVSKAKAQVANAQTEYNRYQLLYEQGAVTEEDRDNKLKQLQTAQADLKQAQNQTKSLSEVRPVDVEVAQTQLNDAIAQLNKAKVDLESSYVRAPSNGRILKINAYPGEAISDTNGVVDFGQTNQMYVSADVYQTDIRKVHVGKPAYITADAFDGDLTGKVTSIGWLIDGQSVNSTDPLTDTDARVIRVKIRLDEPSSKKAMRLSYLQVKVKIDP